MSAEGFQLTTLVRVLAEDVELAEALGVTEVSALDDAERKWRPTLEARVKAILEDAELSPARSLHRRHSVAGVELDAVEITFDPPRRAPDWQEPVRLRVPFARWAEEDLHHAYVPALGVHVFATRAAQLPERVTEHVRLRLASRHKHITLRRLAALERAQELRLGKLEFTVARQTPKQLAAAGVATSEKTPALAKLAEELPPLLPPPGEGGRAPGKSRPPPPAAFEMEAELRHLAEALSGPHRRSVLLVGPPGCGKSALVRELARRRAEFGFGHTAFWTTNAARLMTGPIGFGMWQERCQAMCREANQTNALLHLGHLGELLEVGKTSRGEQGVGGFLRPWLARGEVLAVAECTPEQLEAIARQEPHLLGVFQQMSVAERSPEQTRKILEQVFHATPGIPDPAGLPPEPPPSAAPGRDGRTPGLALDRLHRLHLRYATYSANPGRPLRFLKNLLADQFPRKDLSEADVIAAFSRETGLPPVLLDDQVPLDLAQTRDWFTRRIIGQPEAAERVLDLLATVKARLARPRRPLASFLFIGPTGTGKTEMAKALAEFLFGDAGRMVRFDLNEFSDPRSLPRLIGGPAAGGAEGLLTARVREQPFSVVLLDEFEKADPGFFDLLLQVLGDGRLTDGAGRVADFCNSVIVMTSNLGASGFPRRPAGFRAPGPAGPDAGEYFSDAVRKFLRPEIFNRIDAVLPFSALTPEMVLAIARRHLDLVRQRDGLWRRGVVCDIRPEVAEHLAVRGYDARYGARPLKRALERELLVPLAEALNAYAKDTPLRVEVGLARGCVRIEVRARHARDGSVQESRGTDALAEAVVAQRRRIARLQSRPAVARIEDNVTLLESLDRRTAAARRRDPEPSTRLAKLARLRECLAALDRLAERARHLETEALGFLYRREALEGALFRPELDALEHGRQQLVREVFRLQLEQPDEVVVAIFGEPREAFLDFAAAYFGLAGSLGKVVALDCFSPPPGGRSAATKLVRQTPKTPAQFFSVPPKKAIGLVMHVRGDLVAPRFQAEAGLHLVKAGPNESVCLVEEAKSFADYKPPDGVDRPGAIQTMDAPLCRAFDREKECVTDNVLGRRPWTDNGLERSLAALMEDRLNRALEEMAT